MKAWLGDEETEMHWIKHGHAADTITENFDEAMEDYGLYKLRREEVVRHLIDTLEYHIAEFTLWLAGVLKIAAETTVPQGMSVREHKRNLFEEIYASDEGRKRILSIAAEHIYDVQYREDRADIRRLGRTRGSKLNGQQARDIRYWWKHGKPTPQVWQIASYYSVSKKCIYNILNDVTFQAAGWGDGDADFEWEDAA